MTRIGTAQIEVVADLSKKSLDGLGGAIEGQTKKSGSRATRLLGTALKKGAVVAGAGMASVLGASITKGFSRLQAIEEAQSKLRGLGHDAKSVTGIMESATNAVRGTAFGLGDAASAAASAVASGVKPGKDLQRTLTLVGDAATIAGVEYNEMGAIFNKVAATNKVQGEVLNQLGERGIPIIQLLAKEMGVTSAEAVKMASQGKVNFDIFRNAIENGMGGAALESGKTFRGALANVGAALGRFGAALIGPAFAAAPGIFMKLQGHIDGLIPVAERATAVIGDAFTQIRAAAASAWPSIQPVVDALGDLAVAVGKISVKTVTGIMKALQNKAVQSALVGIAAALGLVLAKMVLVSAAAKAVTLGYAAMSAALKAARAAQIAWAAVTAVNPLTAIILGLTALAAGLVYAYKNSETFRNIVNAAFEGIKSVALSLWGVIKTVAEGIGSALMTAFGVLSTVVKVYLWPIRTAFAILGVVAIQVWNAIRAAVVAVWGFIQPYVSKAIDKIKTAIAVMGAIASRVFGAIRSVAVPIWNTIRTAAVNVFSRVRSAAESFGAAISKVFGGVKDFLGGIWDGLSGGATRAFGFVKDKLNGIIDGINRVIGGFNKLPGPDIPKIKKLARGTDYWSGGTALVGELGPELVHLPRGAAVTPALTTSTMMQEAGATNNITVNVGPGTSTRELVREIDWLLRYGSGVRA